MIDKKLVFRCFLLIQRGFARQNLRKLLKAEIIILFFSVSLFFAFDTFTKPSHYQFNFLRSIQFILRDWSGINPSKIDPQIKIYALDDQAIEFLQNGQLSSLEWFRVFDKIFEAGASLVIIDKIFRFQDFSQDDFAEISKKSLKFREKLFSIGWVSQSETNQTNLIRNSNIFPYSRNQVEQFTQSKLQFYGPHFIFQDILKNVGHANYEGNGLLHPYFITKNGKIRSVATKIVSKAKNIPEASIDNSLPLDQNGYLIVNFPNRTDLERSTISLRSLLARSKLGRNYKDVIPDKSIVIILPSMFTGSTDLFSSPIGKTPGGWFLVSAINTILTEKWIHPPSHPIFALLISAMIGIVLAHIRSSIKWLICKLGTLFLVCIIHLSIFLYLNIEIFTGNILLAYIISGVSMQFVTQFKELTRRQLKRAKIEVETVLAENVQKTFISNRSSLNNLTIRSHFCPASRISGDWFNIFELSPKISLIAIADVTGHGLSSSLMTGVLSGLIQREILTFDTSRIEEELMSIGMRLNQIISNTGGQAERCVTMNLSILDSNKNEGYLLNAGHTIPYIIRNGIIIPWLARGNVFGLDKDYHCKITKRKIEEGDTLFFYTDGLTENKDSRGRCLKSRDLYKILLASPDIQNIYLELKKDVNSRSAPNNAEDDACFLLIKFSKSNKGEQEIAQDSTLINQAS